ncbi:hypothetical protein FF36_05494 [Frankia torreyi]|uniref:Polyketide cyclase / dehydrase and lipid transport n=1 Tax=Frankia torreyi TaxID=1856 RepID=A0A0D8BA39_9ACTN|nr:hypothetical protein [Frankia torreyi]KJE20217.1 hypothetical protein FF36_05494 [Frankia torreyi]KQM02522.1 hypothetical protein FF86_106419 [Frankia sp. CpI1-P]
MRGKRLAIAGGLWLAAYERVVKPWQQRWGATDDEVDASLVGDSLVAQPATQVTRAITIDAPPARVWPWIVQLGADRGGFYSYDWLENLVGLRIHSADSIVDAWQELNVGDVVYASRNRSGGWYVQELRPDEVLVLKLANLPAGRPIRRDEKLRWEFLWSFTLRPIDPNTTRLFVRERVAFDSVITRTVMAPIGLVSFVMTRRMMLGIKTRAERPPLLPPAA